MRAEKKVRTYTRRTKSGKTITVKEHTAKYEAADKKDAAKKEGAGKELEERKKSVKLEWGRMSARQIKDAKEIMEQTGISKKEAIKAIMSYEPQKGEIGSKESGRRLPHARGRKPITKKTTIHKEVSSGDRGTKRKMSLSKKSTPSKIDAGKSVMNLPIKGIPAYPVRGRKTKK